METLTLNEKVTELVVELNIEEAEHLKKQGYINLCFFTEEGKLTDQYKVTAKEKKKYINIDFGGSGAFMIDKTTNLIYNIKSYGTPNKKKCYGSIFDLNGIKLHRLRWDYRKPGRR